MLSSLEFHKDFSPLRVSTNEIGVDGLKLKQTLSVAAMDALLFEPSDPDFCFKSRAPLTLSCLLERENEHSFKVSLQGDLTLYTLCGSCLDPMDIPCPIDFHIRMMEEEHIFGPEDLSFDSADVKGDDPLVGYFRDRCIDLGIILREQIFLQMPDYPQCAGVDGSFRACNKSLLASDENSLRNDNPFVKLFKK